MMTREETRELTFVTVNRLKGIQEVIEKARDFIDANWNRMDTTTRDVEPLSLRKDLLYTPAICEEMIHDVSRVYTHAVREWNVGEDYWQDNHTIAKELQVAREELEKTAQEFEIEKDIRQELEWTVDELKAELRIP